MTSIHIDGSKGEGGGQILRTALSLSALTGKPFRIDHIRAGRRKPGLLRQHLTALRAAQEVCSARVTGAEIGSMSVSFSPGVIRGGSYRFAVGTAGSACLVAQTIIPMFLHANGACEATFEGGTHNPNAPSYDFLDRVFLVALGRMGAKVDTHIARPGFYPAGGGSFTVRVDAQNPLRPMRWIEAGTVRAVIAEATFAKLLFHVAERELEMVQQGLAPMGLPNPVCRPRQVDALSPGNTVSILIERDVPELVTAFGEVGRPAEQVAQDAVAQAMAFIDANVPVGTHLADQLMLPLALASGGAFRTQPLSEHAKTNLSVIQRFLPVKARTTEAKDGSAVIVELER